MRGRRRDGGPGGGWSMADWFALRGFVHTGRWSQGETLLSSSLTYGFIFPWPCGLKNIHNPKLRVLFYSVENFVISSPEDSNSSDPGENCSKEAREGGQVTWKFSNEGQVV